MFEYNLLRWNGFIWWQNSYLLLRIGCILRWNRCIQFFLVNSIFVSFPVHQIDGVDAAGQVTTVTYCSSPDSMTTACGYDAMREDPDIYKTVDFCGYSASRYFRDMQLPVPSAPSVSDSDQQSLQCEFIPEHLISVMQGMHDENVHFLKPLGRDPCSYFKEHDEARILRALGPDVVICPFCRKKFRAHQKLVSHCKRRHCQALALKCTSCTKIFGDSYALKLHMKVHSNSGRVHNVMSVARHILQDLGSLSIIKFTLLERFHVDFATNCSPSPRHWLCTRKPVQSVLELIMSLKRKEDHISVLTAPRDTPVYMM